MTPDEPLLSIIATPIGNLQDLSFRAREVLRSVDYVLCEDTRRGAKLKQFAGFTAPLISFHEHNEKSRTEKVLSSMKDGKTFALISDAGTPLLSDPGISLVRKMNEEHLPYTFIPGASAITAALILSGLPVQPFCFHGFLPVQSARRSAILKKLFQIPEYTIVLFESPDRVLGLLRELGETLGDRDAAVCRELTKLHEEVLRGKLSALLAALAGRKLLGEFTIVVGPAGGSQQSITMSDESIQQRFEQLSKEGYSRKEALKKLAKESGRSRNDIYKILTQSSR